MTSSGERTTRAKRWSRDDTGAQASWVLSMEKRAMRLSKEAVEKEVVVDAAKTAAFKSNRKPYRKRLWRTVKRLLAMRALPGLVTVDVEATPLQADVIQAAHEGVVHDVVVSLDVASAAAARPVPSIRSEATSANQSEMSESSMAEAKAALKADAKAEAAMKAEAEAAMEAKARAEAKAEAAMEAKATAEAAVAAIEERMRATVDEASAQVAQALAAAAAAAAAEARATAVALAADEQRAAASAALRKLEAVDEESCVHSCSAATTTGEATSVAAICAWYAAARAPNPHTAHDPQTRGSGMRHQCVTVYTRAAFGTRRASKTAPVWKDDDEATACEACATGFSFFEWRHHCRACGGLFCSACSRQRVALPEYGPRWQEPNRVCDVCATFHTGLTQQRACDSTLTELIAVR
jgi:hypothetical protein